MSSSYSVTGETFYITPTVANVARKLSKGRVLDAGCGNGVYFPHFNAKEIYGIEITPEYFKLIDKKKFPKTKIFLKKADVRNMPFKDEYFDFILSSDVIEYMKKKPELLKTIKELKRVLKFNGILLVTVPHKSSITHLFRKKILPIFLKRETDDINFVMGREFSRKEMEAFGFKTYGCLGWVTTEAIKNKLISSILDRIFWYFPVFSGTLVCIYEKESVS